MPAVSVSDDQLRPALELAFAVALAGTRLRPPVPPPAPLKAYLKFQRLPASALPVVRRVVEDDEEFRRRTAGIATPDLAGELGLVWLTRPDGWEDVVDRLAQAAAEADRAAEDEQRAQRAERRREAAEQAAARAKAELVALRIEVEREKTRRHDAERRVADLQRDALAARRRAEQAETEARATKERGANAVSAADAAHAAKRELTARVAELEAVLEDALASRVAAEQRAADIERLGLGSAPAGPAPELGRAAHALQETALALRQLAGALDATGVALGEPARPRHHEHAERAVRRPGAANGRTPRRTPLAIPGGLFGDSEAAATHLIKQPNVTLLVDGYNLAKLGWPGLPLEHQRVSSLDALEGLVRRTGVRTIVMFDGADIPATTARRRLVRVRFSPADVTADDAIRDLLGDLPVDQPVIVATNDQAIVRDVRAAGANVISSDQLLALARR